MSAPEDPDLGLDPRTLAVRAGTMHSGFGEHSEALYLTSSYVFENCAQAAARFAGDEPGVVYSRYTNPTVSMFEQRLAALEGAADCIATASGMGAILSLFLGHLRSGDHLVCSRDVFGSTVSLINNYLLKFGVEVSYVPLARIEDWRAAMRPNTRLLFAESPSNPLNEVADIASLAELAHSKQALLAIDNCFCTPVLQQPLVHGADLVVHSATKFIDGQGRCLGGAVLGSDELVEPIRGLVRAGGTSMSPFNAWVFLKGLETLSLRMQAHCENAQALAQWLEQQSWVQRVYYAGLPAHPGHALAARQQRLFGGVLAFEIRGDREAAWRFIDATRLLSLTANLGDAKTTIVHPATTTHGRLSDAERAEAGISDPLIRVAAGLEALEDIQADLLRGAAAL